MRLQTTQVWDVNAGVGTKAFAEKDLPLSGGEGLTFYRGQEKLPRSPETSKWFDNLMIE